MEQLAQDLLIQLSAVIISVVTTVVGVYLKRWLSTSAIVAEYGLYNDKVERVLENAIMYAEGAAKRVAERSITKRELAIEYIDLVSPDVVKIEGDKLETMIDRKVTQLMG